MAAKPLSPEVTALINTYQKAQVNLINIIATQEARDNVTRYRKAILSSVNEELRTLNKYAEGWAQEVIPAAYKTGAANTYAAFRAANVDVGKVAINQKVINSLVTDATGQLMDASRHVARMIDDEIRRSGVAATAEKLSLGDTVKQAKVNLINNLTDKGITAIRYANGRMVKLDEYASLVARTTTREATNKASMDAVRDLGYDLVQITSTFSTCPICATYEGRVYSISGKDKRYPILDEAFSGGYSTIHPNCFIDAQTPIYTSKGFVSIGKIKVGDLVLSHRGKMRKVTELHRNIGRPTIVKLFINGTKAKNCLQSLTVTSNHPIMINGKWDDAINAKQGDTLQVLSHPCENCGEPTFLWKKTCCSECEIALRNKKRDTPEWRAKLAKSCKIGTQKRYDAGLDAYAITKNANIKTRQMVKDGTHPFSNLDNIIKGQKSLGSKHFGKTWIEEKVGWYLSEKLGIEVEPQFPIPKSLDTMGRQRYYFADFLIKGHKIVVECDGENWHTDIEKDSERQRFIENLGYTVIRFTQKQIKENLSACGDEVLRVLANHNDKYVFMDAVVTDIIISESKRTHTLYNFSVDKDESYIAKGFVVHNCTHSAVPYFEEFDDNAAQLRRESNRSFNIDPRSKASIDAYNKDQSIKAARRLDRNEFEKAKLLAPKETPKSFSGFRSVKRSNSQRYLDIKAKL